MPFSAVTVIEVTSPKPTLELTSDGFNPQLLTSLEQGIEEQLPFITSGGLWDK